jgi:hypothetical protein
MVYRQLRAVSSPRRKRESSQRALAIPAPGYALAISFFLERIETNLDFLAMLFQRWDIRDDLVRFAPLSERDRSDQ